MVNRDITLSLSNLLRAWEELAPEAAFAGMSLEQFREATASAFTNRQKLTWLTQERAATVAARAASDRDAVEKYLLVVNAIKGSPAQGENSPLYRSLGYVTKSERRSGLTRKTVGTEAVAAN